MTMQANRRDFLKATAATGAVLVIGTGADGVLAAGDAGSQLNPFVSISSDGTVQVLIKHFEMGQGTTTGLATLVAEELDADWGAVVSEFAPGDGKLYANLFFGAQGTGGSTAVANSFMQYRQAGAAARAVLVQAAAEEWGVDPMDVTVENGVLKSGGKTAGFGDMIEKAATLTPPAEPKVKDPSEFKLIGKDGLPRKDSHGKTTGTATFAMDVTVPGMVYAVLLRPPRFGATLTSFDASGAKDVQGFVDAKAMPNKSGVVVYANSTWAAISARETITAEWDFAEAENRSSDALIEYHLSLLDKPEYQTRKDSDPAAAEEALKGAAKTLEAEFTFPNLAHAPMEPLNCVIEPTEDGVRVHDGCQFPGLVQPTLGAVLELKPEQIDVRTVYAGGSFGRRANPPSDYQVEAALAFMMLGRKTPVKMVWTREDDIRGGFYRPMAAHRARIGMDDDGNIVGWDHRIAAKSLLKGTFFEGALVHNGIDETSVEGASNTTYTIPAMSVGLSDAQTPIPVLWWRSVGHTHTAFVMESLMDMAAHEAGEDPLAFRLKYLADGSPDNKRLSGVLRLAAEKAGWSDPLPEGRGRGVAVHKSFNSYIAEVVEVSVDDGSVKIEKVTCAVDCGLAVNPDVIRAQMEGGIGFGLGAVMRNAITLTDGEVDQSNFPDYEPIRMGDMPDIEVHIVESTEAPTGVGEPGVPPAGPALANAIFSATGTRVTNLPMSENGISFG